jgi:hypothetical protein
VFKLRSTGDPSGLVLGITRCDEVWGQFRVLGAERLLSEPSIVVRVESLESNLVLISAACIEGRPSTSTCGSTCNQLLDKPKIGR